MTERRTRMDWWSNERIAELRGLWMDGLSTSKIGERMGITKNAVVGKAHRLDLPKRESPIQMSEQRQLSKKAKAAARGAFLRAEKEKLQEMRQQVLPPLHTGNIPPRVVTRPRPAVVKAVSLPKQPSSSRGPCQFPFGHPREKGFRFCGEPSLFGKPYCAFHARKCYLRKGDATEAQEAA